MRIGRLLNIIIVASLLLSALPAQAQPQPSGLGQRNESPSPAGTVGAWMLHDAYAKAPALDARWSADYGRYVWAEIPVERLALLDASGLAYSAVDLTISVYGYSFDPLRGEPDVPATLSARLKGNQPGLHLVQFAGPIQDSWLKDLQATGLKPLQYYAHNTYLVWGDSAATDAAARADYVRWAGNFQPAYKLDPQLRDKRGQINNIAVTFYNDGNLKGTLDTLASQGQLIQYWAAQPDQAFYTAILTLDAARLTDIAQVTPVWAIEYSSPRPGLDDESADQIVAGNYTAGTPVTGYYNWLAAKGVDGSGVTWADVDTGLDATHPDITGRAVAYVAYAGAPAANTDSDGHGSHTAGAIMGDGRDGVGVSNPSAALDPNGFYWGVGMAPNANLVVQNALMGTNWPPTGGWNVLSRDSVLNGAVGSSNSWYTGSYNASYTAACREHDLMVRDAVFTTTNVAEPIIYIFSAGNGGPNASTLSEPHASKNPVMVGASANYPRAGASINDLADFSSRGPSTDGRNLPTVAAPGWNTVSFNSSTGSSSCNTAVSGAGGTYYSYCSGTSMACPLVAGSSALIVDWWQQEGKGVPSPALVKAMLVNGADDMVGGDDGNGGSLTNIPNSNVGWGRVNLNNTIRTDVPAFYADQQTLLTSSGESWQTTLIVGDTSKPVKVSLVWTDAAGAAGANPALVNDLNLSVLNNATTYLGNDFTSGWSTTGGTADALNNVENVFLPAGTSGAVNITVDAFNIAGDGVPYNGDSTDQDFALVCYNCYQLGVGRLEGNVYDADTLASLPDVSIQAAGLAPTHTGSATSDASGDYGMGLISDTYTVTTSAYGYLPAEIGNVSIVSGTTTTLDIALTQAPAFAVSGVVRDAATGWPLYAEINVAGYPGNPVWNDPVTGYYNVTLPGYATHTFSVEAWAPGYQAGGGDVWVDSALTADFELDADMTACTAPGYALAGVVLDESFESWPLPAGWEIVNNGGTCLWRAGSDGDDDTNQTGGTGEYADADSDDCGSGTTMNTELRSPVMNLIGQPNPTLEFKSDMYYYNSGGSEVWDVDMSLDGGSTWTVNLLSRSGASYRGPETISLPMTGAGGQSNVRLRFHYYNAAYDYWWQVDDVLVSFGASVCSPQAGGLVVGNVYDDNASQLALNGAGVENEDGYTTISVATPNDPAVDDGFYTLFSPAGGRVFSATLSGYGVDSAAVTVALSDTVRQDFYLPTGLASAQPTPLTAIVDLGDSGNMQLTINNLGGLAFDFELKEKAGGYTPARQLAGEDVLVVSVDNTAATAMETALTSLGYTYLDVESSAFQTMAVADLLTYKAVFYMGSTTGDSWAKAMQYLDNGGSLYISDNDLGYYSNSTTFYQQYLQASYIGDDGAQNGGGPATGLDIMSGLDLNLSSDPYPDYFSQNAEGVRIFQYVGGDGDGDAAGVAVDRAGYKAIYTSFDFNYMAANSDEVELVSRIMGFLANDDPLPWLSQSPVSGTVSAGGSVAVNVTFGASVPEVTAAGDYYGTLEVTNNTPYGKISIPVTMTVMPAMCEPVTGVSLSRQPAGAVLVGNPVMFMADVVSGSVPFTYAWTLNGAPLGWSQSVNEYTFGAAGSYTLGVTVDNACGSVAASPLTLVVDSPTPGEPDLSLSSKDVSLAFIEGGDILTYTIVLRNQQATTATAILTDPIPAKTSYIPGRATASDGGAVTVNGGTLSWAGEVASGTPVVIQFAVEVTNTGLTLGEEIVNTAQVNDGWGNLTDMEASSTVNPGYGLTINDGALYTNNSSVNLGYTYDTGAGITHFRLSNDGGFPSGASSAWMPVNASNPTYNGWALSTYGSLILPRYVFVKFRTPSGQQYGPYMDEIIYDPTAPQVVQIDIITPTLHATEQELVTVQVTSSDDNSGVSEVHLSNTPDFAVYSSTLVTNPVMDIAWTIHAPAVYVRVVDRAGNMSAVKGMTPTAVELVSAHAQGGLKSNLIPALLAGGLLILGMGWLAVRRRRA